jgi:hypothetical protein
MSGHLAGEQMRETVMTTHAQESHQGSFVPTSVPEQKTFDSPDQTRTFEHGRVDLVQIGGADIGRLTLEPGWRWSQHVRPIAGTELCEAPHFQYHVSGTLRIEMADGTSLLAGPGDVTALPHGHDAWVVGDEPVVVVDWWGASNYAKG